MTRKEAAEIIERIKSGDIVLYRPVHALRRLGGRDYAMNDVYAILRVHEMEHAPTWNEEHREFRVSLIGKCLQGRLTRVILGLRRDGVCALITIMQNRTPKRRIK